MKKLTILLSILVLAGCTTGAPEGSDSQSSNDSQTIITSFYPIEYLTEQITGQNFEILNLTQGKDPHSYSLTPQDIQNIENSDLFIFQGAGLEPWAEDFEDSQTLNILELSEGVELIEYSEEEHDDHHDDKHSEDEEHHDDDHEDEHHADEEHNEDDHGHDHGEFDPHTWLDPILAQDMANQILSEVIKLDPNNEDSYNQNYEDLVKSLSELDEKYTSSLAACTNKKAISSHDAFSYLESRYDFQLISIAGLSPQSIPSSQKIQELVSLAEQENITHILEEEFTDKSFSEVVKSEAALDSLTINTLESSPEAGEDYLSVMNTNLESFVQAFGCNSQ